MYFMNASEGGRREGAEEHAAASARRRAATFADVDALVTDIGFPAQDADQEGIQRFVDWYKDFYGVN